MTKAQWIRYFKEYWPLYLFLAPVIIHTFVFAYMPMYGAQIAFRNFRVKDGILGSEWVGLMWFEKFFSSHNFRQILWNLRVTAFTLKPIHYPEDSHHHQRRK